ncbi:DNA topoisomerase IV subunit B [Candidatus Synchoanobacter obligatus]|uniref:DNA topoisomerase 4 subunit B n=1 Tax=Candidatus Synchoanobacter obligatus TaxID=2919597 RepID=A0ABT1L585_9GAMM|nr:DNA topoisomerase IV subunit B [Candidatus Synchoanobacter obligatus]MCP8352116.1 DNA topoisomerase IV subunit B [Candidatus Synchoanobacter obligatus]
MSNQYTAQSIEVLEGLDPVKKRPGMYTKTESPFHTACELIDNSADEAMNDHADLIMVTMHADGSISCEDNGRGMPVDMHPEHGVTGIELILTRLHAGAKFSNKEYAFSGGLHGVGVSVVNALAKRLDVEVKQGGKRYSIGFSGGVVVSPLQEVGSVRNRDTGTKVRYLPDPIYFDDAAFQAAELAKLLQSKAILCPGLKTCLSNEVTGEKESWRYETGIKTYLLDMVGSDSILPATLIAGEQSSDMMVEWALTWETEPGVTALQESFVNVIRTPQGGTHENGFRSGVLEAVRDFCALHQLLPRGIKLKLEDVCSHSHFVLSLKMPDPQFVGQTKERLSSRTASHFVMTQVRDAMSLWLNQHVDDAKILVESFVAKAQIRLRKAKKVTRAKPHQAIALPGKLVDCIEEDLAYSELFLVEGDSAGGSARQARDKKTQAVMPLRGKVLNTWEVSSDQVLASQSVHDIAVAIGVDPGSEDLASLRYGKVCILADADSDGAHIASLLCALFVKHFPALVRSGRVFVAMPPLYRIEAGRKVLYALDESEKEAHIKEFESQGFKNISVIRFKGLGEMSAKQLRETAMSHDTRRMVQLLMEDESESVEKMDLLLAKKRAKDRKQWLEA